MQFRTVTKWQLCGLRFNIPKRQPMEAQLKRIEKKKTQTEEERNVALQDTKMLCILIDIKAA